MTEEKIRLRAHAIYINRIAHPRLLPGAYHILGTAESDWLQAEREIEMKRPQPARSRTETPYPPQ